MEKDQIAARDACRAHLTDAIVSLSLARNAQVGADEPELKNLPFNLTDAYHLVIAAAHLCDKAKSNREIERMTRDGTYGAAWRKVFCR